MCQCREPSSLHEMSGRNKQILLERYQATNRCYWRDHIPEPKPSHRVPFGESIKHKAALTQRQRGSIPSALVEKTVIHLIGQHRNPKSRQVLHYFRRLHSSGRVCRRRDQDPFGAVCDYPSHPINVDLITVFWHRRNKNWAPSTDRY